MTKEKKQKNKEKQCHLEMNLKKKGNFRDGRPAVSNNARIKILELEEPRLKIVELFEPKQLEKRLKTGVFRSIPMRFEAKKSKNPKSIESRK